MKPFTNVILRATNRTHMLRTPSNFVNAENILSTPALKTLNHFQGLRFYSDNAKKEVEEKDASNDIDEKLSENQKSIGDLEEKLAIKTKEVADLKDRLLRSVADFRNLQELTKKDIQKAKDFALQKFAKDLLESVDNFGHALNAFKPETLKESDELADLYAGVKMTRDVFEKTLKKHGIEKLDPMGETFNPNKHEATFESHQPDQKPGTIFHVQQCGFTLNERVIRPAKVGIVRDPEN